MVQFFELAPRPPSQYGFRLSLKTGGGGDSFPYVRDLYFVGESRLSLHGSSSPSLYLRANFCTPGEMLWVAKLVSV